MTRYCQPPRDRASSRRPLLRVAAAAAVLSTLSIMICPAFLAIVPETAQSFFVKSASAATMETFESVEPIPAERTAVAPLALLASPEMRDVLPPAAADSSLSDADVALLLTLEMPEAALARMAADAAKLKLPVVLRGLPMKTKSPASPDAAPYQLDKAKAQAALAPLIDAGASVLIDPRRFRRAFAHDPSVPALVIGCSDEKGDALEVFPGEVRPRFAAAWAAQNAAAPCVRRAAEALLANAGLGLNGEALHK